MIPYEYIIGAGVCLVLCNVIVLGGLWYFLFKGGLYKKVEKQYEFYNRFKRMNNS